MPSPIPRPKVIVKKLEMSFARPNKLSEVAKVFTDEGWWDSVDKDAKKLLLNKAEEIYAANPKLGREGALLQAAEVAPTTTGQPKPKEDSFAGKKIN